MKFRSKDIMWTEDVDDSEFIIGGLVYPQEAYIKELPTGWKTRCKTYEECKKGKTMDSAKKSVEKILEIANKHGYDCIVALVKDKDMEVGVHAMNGSMISSDLLSAYTELKRVMENARKVEDGE